MVKGRGGKNRVQKYFVAIDLKMNPLLSKLAFSLNY